MRSVKSMIHLLQATVRFLNPGFYIAVGESLEKAKLKAYKLTVSCRRWIIDFTYLMDWKYPRKPCSLVPPRR